jgi:membrane AbrB-like protein
VRIPPLPAVMTLAAAVVLGFLGAWLRVPLAWVLGPLTATACASIAGYPVFAPVSGRRLGQGLVGTSIGLTVTPEALALALAWSPVMVTTALVSILLSAALSVPFAWAGRVDQRTAFFALTPGGLAEMANIGLRVGAQAEPVAIAHAIRVAMLVCLMPPLIVALGIDGGLDNPLARIRLTWPETAAALAFGCIGIGVARLLRFNNPWTIGGILGAGAATASGLLAGRMPEMLFALGQFMIGISIGARFQRESLMRLPRVCVGSVVSVIALSVLLFGYAALLSATTGIDLASAALGSSPGGMAEMALTAQVLHLNVALVTAFHIVRSFLVNAFMLQFYRAFEQLGFFSLLKMPPERTANSD